MSTSVVLCTYNGEKFIGEQLESLRLQTLSPSEVFISDDCSTDSTAEIVAAYIKKHGLHNWHLVCNTVNKGFRQNFMDALSAASGDLLFPCDQDDVWARNKIERMVETMRANPQIDLLASSYDIMSEDGEDLAGGAKASSSGSLCSVERSLYRLNLPVNILNVPFPGCTYGVKKTFVEECSKYWDGSCPHDALLYRSALLKGTAYAVEDSLITQRRYATSSWSREVNEIALESEIRWRKQELKDIDFLLEYVADKKLSQAAEDVLSQNRAWVKARLDLAGKHYLKVFELVRYRKMYSLKAIVKDFQIATGTYKG